MNRTLRFLLLAFLLVLGCTGLSVVAQDDEAAARIPVEMYLKAQATGDPELIRKAFHPEAKLFFNREGKFTQLTRDEFAARFSGKPAPDEAQRKRTIDSLTVTGDAAMAKLTLDYPNAVLTDYLSLLKVDGEWKIVHKIFNARPKAAKQ